MSHIPYLEPLLNHLKDCIPEVGKNFFVKAFYDGVDSDNQFYPAIWIIPRESTVQNVNSNTSSCKSSMIQSINICAVVNCKRSLKRHFDISVDNGECTLLGPYIDGADLLFKAKCCVDEFNSISKMEPLILSNIHEPDYCNGHLVHVLEYKTQIYY